MALLGICLTSAVVWVARRAGAADKNQTTSTARDAPRYVGTGVCLACHAEQANRWRFSRHRDAMAEVSGETVLGSFVSWSDISVGCEACHGPGSRHVKWARYQMYDGTDEHGVRGLTISIDERRGVACVARIRYGRFRRMTCSST